MYDIKESTKITKIYNCSCGAQNKFDIDTDLVIEGFELIAKCQNCGRRISINFGTTTSSSSISSTSSLSQEQSVQIYESSNSSEGFDMYTLSEAAQSESLSQSSSQLSENESGEEKKIETETDANEEDLLSSEKTEEYSGDISSEEERAIADLFGKL